MSKGLMPIGMFSLGRACSGSKHCGPITRPESWCLARVDPSTGYRSYLSTQLADAAVLRRLRALDLPLSDVGEILRARDPEVTRKVLTGHSTLLQERLAQIQTAVAEIQASVVHPISQPPVHVRNEPATLTLEIRGQVAEADFKSFLDAAYPVLYEMLGRLGLPPAGPPGALYPAVIEDVQQVIAYVPVAEPVQLPDDRGDVALGELPAATIAVLTHHGGYDTIAETYRLLGRWVSEHASSADLEVREVYVIGPTEAEQPDAYRTDICWPLAIESTETPYPTGGLP